MIVEIFTKSDCAPCKVVLGKLKETSTISLVERSLDDPEELMAAKKLGIRAVPTVRVMDSEGERLRFSGNDILEWIKRGLNG